MPPVQFSSRPGNIGMPAYGCNVYFLNELQTAQHGVCAPLCHASACLSEAERYLSK